MFRTGLGLQKSCQRWQCHHHQDGWPHQGWRSLICSSCHSKPNYIHRWWRTCGQFGAVWSSIFHQKTSRLGWYQATYGKSERCRLIQRSTKTYRAGQEGTIYFKRFEKSILIYFKAGFFEQFHVLTSRYGNESDKQRQWKRVNFED